MQLHMTTPVDIGLEAAQQGVGGDDGDFMFDLGEIEGRPGKQRVKKGPLPNDDLSGSESGESNESEEDESEDDDSEDANSNANDSNEDEQRFVNLEANLDLLYDEYQNTKLAKDAKHRVKEARKKRDAEAGVGTSAEGWGGIKASSGESQNMEEEAEESDFEDDENDADTMAYLDQNGDEIPADELDSSDDDSNVENHPLVTSISKKRKRNGNLLQDLKIPKKPLEATAKSRAAAMWFDQAVFKDVNGMDEIMNDGGKAEDDMANSKSGETTRKKARFEVMLLIW